MNEVPTEEITSLTECYLKSVMMAHVCLEAHPTNNESASKKTENFKRKSIDAASVLLYVNENKQIKQRNISQRASFTPLQYRHDVQTSDKLTQ